MDRPHQMALRERVMAFVEEGHVWTASLRQVLIGAAAIAVECGHVSGLSVQPIPRQLALMLIREAGPDHSLGLEARDPSRFSHHNDRPIDIIPLAPPQL